MFDVKPFGRRGFLKSLGGGLLVLFAVQDETEAQESGRSRGYGGQPLPQNLAAWLHIAPDGAITVFTGKVEVGQNIRTSLTQAVADELRCPVASIHLVMGDTALTPFDMGTFGSRTTPTMAPVLRKMASTARETLGRSGCAEVGRGPKLPHCGGCVCEESGLRQERQFWRPRRQH